MTIKGAGFGALGLAFLAVPLFASTQTTCPTLAIGSTGASVTALQTFLHKAYTDFPTPTGRFGPLTQAAVKQWQGEHGIEKTGMLGPKTRVAMGLGCASNVSSTVTKPTASSSTAALIQALLAQVKILQEKLAALLAANAGSVNTTGTVATTDGGGGGGGGGDGGGGTTPPACTPLTAQTQNLVCPTGQTGFITQTKTSTCAAGATTPTWGEWTTTTSTCTTPAGTASCILDSVTVAHGASKTFFPASTVPYGQTCTGQSRTCTNGTLSGNVANNKASCSVTAAASCTFNGSTVAHAASVTAYQSTTVPYGSQCVSEQRTCSNGTLSGSYVNASCSVQQPTVVSVGANGVAFPSTSQPGTVYSTPFLKRVDPETGFDVYQVSPFTGKNDGFYFDTNSAVEGENAFVYRNMRGTSWGELVGSLVYLKVDIDKQETMQITPVGMTNGGIVRGKWLYVSAWDTMFSPGYNHIERFNLDDPSLHETLVRRDSSADDVQVLTVSNDGASMLYGYKNPDGSSTISVLDIASRTSRVVMNTPSGGGIFHSDFGPQDSSWFRYVNVNGVIGDLITAFGVARTDTLRYAWMSTSLDYFQQGHVLRVLHPFFDMDNNFWVDAITDDATGYPSKYFKFTLSNGGDTSAPASIVTGVEQYSLAYPQWQIHTNRTNVPYWFVGEGNRAPANFNAGVPMVQLIHLNPTTHTVETFPIAYIADLYTDSGTSPEVHWLSNNQSITFNDIADFLGSPLRLRNVFVVKVPNAILQKMAAGTP